MSEHSPSPSATAPAGDPAASTTRTPSESDAHPSQKSRMPRWLRRLSTLLLGHAAGRVLLCALSGTLLFLACADFDIWPLCWLGMVPLLWVLLDRQGQPRTSRPFLYGFVTGLFANGGGFYWIVGLLMRFGHLPFIAALPLFLLLIGYQAITFGIFAAVLCRLRRHVDVPVTWLAPLIWVACELCVPYVFPWYLSITQAWVPPVIQIADITGPLGVSFVLVLSNAALWQLGLIFTSGRILPRRGLLIGPSLRPPILAAVTILLVLGYGMMRIHQVEKARAAAPKIRVGVVQANIGIHEKFVPGLRERQHALHLSLSQTLSSRGADLILWPESSYPYPLPRTFHADFPDNDPRKLQRGFTTPLLFGALTLERRGNEWAPYNTALLLDKQGQVRGSFDKNFLLIFGEYLPFARQLSFLRELIPAISNFERGTETTTFPFELEGKRYNLGPMICYEDIIPAFGRRLFADKNPPNLLLNITNDAWFGATSEPYEHLALAVYRAVEHRTELVRAVNTGVSAYIDATGRIVQKGPSVDPTLTPDVEPVALLQDMALLPPGGLYQRLGEAFGGLCLGLVLLLGLLARHRAGRPLRLAPAGVAFVGLHALLVSFSLVLGGPRLLKAFYLTLAHYRENQLPEDLLFQATWQISVLLIVAGLAVGVWLGRKLAAQAEIVAGRLELIVAIVATTVVPVVLFGRMEGNTGAVVILGGLATLAGLLGLRLGARRSA
ncbi:MAG TPA: apolipoprotein N-acyltransferase [Pseudomonadota bacterium]|nr:apolipoprotein N-acyltransferase [Pseudomonadota bacterium]